jgi:hypothetical protein
LHPDLVAAAGDSSGINGYFVIDVTSVVAAVDAAVAEVGGG